MSAAEQEFQTELQTELQTAASENASSVKLTRNAKGDTQIEIKVYVGDTDEELAAVSARAQTIYDALSARYAEAPQPRGRPHG